MFARLAASPLLVRSTGSLLGCPGFRGKHTVSIVLKQDLPPRGYTGDTITVAAGFMRNYLYPGKKAVYATPENLAKFATGSTAKSEEQLKLEAEAAAAAEVKKIDPLVYSLSQYMKSRTVEVKRAVVGKTQTLAKAGSVNEAVFKSKLLKQHKVELDATETVVLPDISELGVYKAQILLKGGQLDVDVKVVKR